MKTLDEIKDAYNNKEYENKMDYKHFKKYSENHVFDEEQSIKWNREQVQIKNQEALEYSRKYREEVNRLNTLLTEDIIKAMMIEYNINEIQAKYVYDYTYSEYHSSGINDVINYLDDILRLIFNFNSVK